MEFDQITWVPTLMKSHDAIGMFYSLEIRPPFLDKDLVHAVNNLPIEQKINDFKQKIITNKYFVKSI